MFPVVYQFVQFRMHLTVHLLPALSCRVCPCSFCHSLLLFHNCDRSPRHFLSSARLCELIVLIDYDQVLASCLQGSSKQWPVYGNAHGKRFCGEYCFSFRFLFLTSSPNPLSTDFSAQPCAKIHPSQYASFHVDVYIVESFDSCPFS